MSPAATPRQAATGPPEARIVLRTSTDAVEAGCAKVMGFEKEAICAEKGARAGRGRPSQEHPYGTGDASVKIVDIIERCIRQPSK